MEAVLGCYWVPWAFPQQFSGDTVTSPVLPSPKVIPMSIACPTLLLGLVCVLNIVHFFTALCVCKIRVFLK